MFKENELLLLGDAILNSKRLLWDTERLLFVPENWDEYGFQVFSQNNEDGLIQYIINHTKLPQKNFIEFGVESYQECNTRFLCLHNNWSGLIMDGSKKWMGALRKQDIYWKRNIESKGVFITKENINSLISESNLAGDIGLLSVDVDGNDYWILDAINCVSPQILICEYNAIFGKFEKVSVPYRPDFIRGKAHYSNLYFGASLAAFVHVANKKGYKLVCLNNLGNNAFFVKRNASDIPEVSIEDAWREPIFRESRDKKGRLSFLSPAEGRNELTGIGNMPVIDIVTGERKQIKNLKV